MQFMTDTGITVTAVTTEQMIEVEPCLPHCVTTGPNI